MSANDFNCPLPSQICNRDGTLTPQGQAFIRRLWERTGYAPGVDAAWIAKEADQSVISSAQALSAANTALTEAKRTMDAAQEILLHVQSIRAQILKALELSQDCAIISTTAHKVRDGSNSSNESMIFTIMKT